MLSFNDKISIRQLQILLILDIFGTGIIIIPRKVAEFANQDGWFIIIITTLLIMLSVYLITSVSSFFPKKNFLEYSSIILGKPLGVLFTLGFIIKLILTIAFELRFFAEIINQTMLANTPYEVVFFAIIMVSAYAAAKGYESRARIAEIIIFIVFVPLIIVFIIAAFDVDYSNLLPVLKTNPSLIAKGGFYCIPIFNGIEFLFLAFPYINKPQKIRTASIFAILFIGTFMLLVTLITIGKFGPFDVKRQMWPVLEIMDTIDFPGSFIERQDALILSVWIVSMFSMINACLFFSSNLVKNIIKKGKHSIYILIIIPISYLLSKIPSNIEEVIFLMERLYFFFMIIYCFLLPLILLFFIKLKRVKKYE